jgi:ketosteroid isomerase-like protein
MSEENVAAYRASFQAWRRGDIETWIESMDPEIEWDFSAYPLPGVANRGTGRDELVQWLAAYISMWRRYEATPKEVIDAGDQLVAVIHETVRARGSDAPIERDLIQVITAREGIAVKMRVYETREEALEAAGLSEENAQ